MQSGAGWALGGVEGDAASLHVSGPSTTPMRGCGGPECRVPLLHVELPVEMEATQTEDVLEWERGGRGMATCVGIHISNQSQSVCSWDSAIPN